MLVTAPDSAVGKNFALEVGGSISGFVYGEGGLPVSGADVWAYSSNLLSVVKWDTTSTDGSYKIGGLRTGWYRVSCYTECDEMFYDRKTSWVTADSVYVTMPEENRNINFNFPSAVEDEAEQITSRPRGFELSQNYPNPFNPQTQIKYTLQKRAQVNLEIYNLLGQKVKMLVNESQVPGSYQIIWDGENDQGKTVSTGIYFYRLEVDGVSQAKRMVLLK